MLSVPKAPQARRSSGPGLSGVLLAGVWAGLAWAGTGVVTLLVSGSVAAALAVGLASGRLAPG